MVAMEEKILEGHTIYLRLPKDEDVLNHDWHMWYNDYETTRYNSHGVFPISREQELDLVKNALKADNIISFAICSKLEGNLIGNCAIQSIDLLNRKAEIALTIGDADYRARTCALESVGLMLDHCFSRLNLNRVYAGANMHLSGWVTMLKVLGFNIEGTLKEDMLRDGEYIDTVSIGVLAKDFFVLKKERNGKILLENLSLLMRAIRKVTIEK
jgi:[ribosomal protein S5]-alanine N-acetyltransferase